MSERILIVEDEPAIAQTLAYALQAEGFATEWVALGAAALQALQLGLHLSHSNHNSRRRLRWWCWTWACRT